MMYAASICRSLLALLFTTGLLGIANGARAQLADAINSWSDATVGLRTGKWGGPRVPFPTPDARPPDGGALSSLRWPVRVHVSSPAQAARAELVLAAAEATFESLYASGLMHSFGDGGQGGSGERDLYLLEHGVSGAGASIDPSPSFAELDSARAFALLDARVSEERLFVCTAQALIEAELLELDPAESEVVRKSGAAYFAWLISGEFDCDGPPRSRAEAGPFAQQDRASGARWLAALGARQDNNRGRFVDDMWQFARQRTWEGRDLRASPDLIEVIAKALSLENDSLSLVAAELAEQLVTSAQTEARVYSWAELPLFVGDARLSPLGSVHLSVRLGEPRPGRRLRVFTQGEPGARYTLVATRRDRAGKALSRIELEPRRDPSGQLSVELDDSTYEVLVTLTHVDDGTPDFDAPSPPRNVSITVDHKQ